MEEYKILRKFNINDEWSDNNIVHHHYLAITQAYDYYNNNNNNNNNIIYEFNEYNIKYKLIPISLKDEIIFLQLKDDNSISYLKYLQKRYIKKEATENLTVNYLDNNIIIKKHDFYYFDNKLNKIVIGWHGSYIEPCDMAGYNIINNNEWF